MSKFNKINNINNNNNNNFNNFCGNHRLAFPRKNNYSPNRGGLKPETRQEQKSICYIYYIILYYIILYYKVRIEDVFGMHFYRIAPNFPESSFPAPVVVFPKFCAFGGFSRCPTSQSYNFRRDWIPGPSTLELSCPRVGKAPPPWKKAPPTWRRRPPPLRTHAHF